MTEPNLVQYIFVPKKPKMSAGKIASQVSKVATLIILKYVDLPLTKSNRLSLKDVDDKLVQWITENGMMTIVLQVRNQVELHNVKIYLEQEKIDFSCYNDEGYTEVPAGTMTAIATSILDKEKNSWRFAKYKLYR